MKNTCAPTKYLLVGHGARETSMARRLSEEGHLVASFSTCSNYGLKLICGDNAYVAPFYDPKKIISLAENFGANIIIPGNELPLYNGLTNIANETNIGVFGPETDFCRFEKDKLFSRKFANDIDCNFLIPSTAYTSKEALLKGIKNFSGPYVIKIWNERRQKYSTYKVEDISSLQKEDDLTKKAILSAKEHNDPLTPVFILEEFIDGVDFTIYVVTDGKRYFFSPSMHDFPFLKEGETGPKTGGMGCISGSDRFSPKNDSHQYSSIIIFIQKYLDKAQQTFPKMKGMFSFQFIRSQESIKFNEIDVRPGDPEMVNFLLLLESRFDSLIESVCSGHLEIGNFSNEATLSSYLVTPGYPLIKDNSYYSLDMKEIANSGCTVDWGPSINDQKLKKLFASCSRTALLSTRASSITKCSQQLQRAIACEGNDLVNLRYRNDIIIQKPF